MDDRAWGFHWSNIDANNESIGVFHCGPDFGCIHHEAFAST